MMLVCGFLGCLGHALKRAPSAASLDGPDRPSANPHNRLHSSGNGTGTGRSPTGHPLAGGSGGGGGLALGRGSGGGARGEAGRAGHGQQGPGQGHGGHAGAANGQQEPEFSFPAPPPEPDPSYLPAAFLAGHGATAAGPSSAAAAMAAVAAATQPAALAKSDRAAAARRTPLHVAAERGQLHVLSAVLESLCCAATAGLLGEGVEEDIAGEVAGVEELGGEEGAQGQSEAAARTAGEFPLSAAAAAAAAGLGRGMVLDPDQYIQLHLNMQDAEGTTALSLCCRAGHTDCCRLLLANGACRLLPDARGNTPLHYAALRGHLGVLFMLLGEFADGPGQREELASYVDARNAAGCTPLHYAVWGRQSGSVQVLLQHGADVLPRTSRPATELQPAVGVVGSTPLHLAAARGHVEICRILLKTFAERVLEPLQLGDGEPQPATLASLDPRVQANANGHLPYQVAQRLGFYPLAMLLRPSIPILRLFSDEERAVRFYGPPPLKAIAAEALNKKLVGELDALAAAAAAAAAAAGSKGSKGGSKGRKGRERGSGGSGGLRPVSAPASMVQRDGEEGVEEGEEGEEGEEDGGKAGGGGEEGQAGAGRGWEGQRGRRGPRPSDHGPVTSSLPVVELTAAAAAAAAAAASMAVASTAAAAAAQSPSGPVAHSAASAAVGLSPSSSRRRAPPPLSIVVSAAPSAGGAAADTPTPGTADVAASRASTPAGGAAPASPAPLSPSLLSPMALATPSPPSSATAGTGSGSGSALVTPRHLRSPSGRRFAAAAAGSASPIGSPAAATAAVPTAAPMVAALSPSPSSPSASAPQEVSLPGQADDTSAARAASGAARGSTAADARRGKSTSGAASAPVSAAGEVLLGPVEGGQGVEAGVGMGAMSPGSQLRQTSAQSLLARRPVAAGLGSPAGAAAAAAAAAGTPFRSPRGSITGSGGAGEVVVVSPTGAGGRPAGLVRLRSNPLFEEPERQAEVEATSPQQQALPVAQRGVMETLVEEAGEGVEQRSSAGSAEEDAAAVVAAAAAAAARRAQHRSAAAAAVGGGGGGGGGGGKLSAIEAIMAYDVGSSSEDDDGGSGGGGGGEGDGEDDDANECGVCMEVLPLVAVAPCRHAICGPCARRICCLNIQKPSHCPFCRATIAAFVAPPEGPAFRAA